MAKHVTGTEFARLKGVSAAAVSQWKADGKIKMIGKLIDVAETEKVLAATMKRKRREPSRLKPAAAKLKSQKPAREQELKLSEAPPIDSPDQPPDAPDVVTPADEVDPEKLARTADAFIQRVLSGEYETTAEAERIKQNALALKHVLDVHHRAGNLVNKARVEREVFDAVRGWRDTWMNWSAKTAPLLAADMGMDPGRLAGLLADYVHKQLLELGGIELDLTEAA